jgi:hypothetical protein
MLNGSKSQILYIKAMEALFGDSIWTHYASEQLRVPFNTSKGCQEAIHNMGLQDMIELCWMESSLFLAVPSHPLCLESPIRPEDSLQFIHSASLVGSQRRAGCFVLYSYSSHCGGAADPSGRENKGCRILYKIKSGFAKVDAKAYSSS